MNIPLIIRHRNTYGRLSLEEDYLTICKGNHCKALVLKILEENTQKAAAEEGPKDFFFPLSYSDFQHNMYDIYGKSSVIAALGDLEKDGLIEKRVHENSYNYVYEYRLNIPIVQQLLDELSEKKGPKSYQYKKPLQLDKIISIASLRSQYEILEKFGGKCAYCQTNQAMVWDHVIPVIKGGETNLNNLAPACINCNSAKRDLDVVSWMKTHKLQPSPALLEIFTTLDIQHLANSHQKGGEQQ
ncbi:HNH endonuclease [Dictyobacter arantiisoli]|uniref:HNH nuclease domain-containing protein n=1 Tax=Dictyobacter arantiisoli TaxID=2014874 RepID=A0A5A5THP3_9CHLR|nr:HNH endonuclease signature motif containing protein [Dictyobacter arantiisoli]GCF10887.1 hypothetical protein KDI_44510 [Dictyobacter arantiisoli]